MKKQIKKSISLFLAVLMVLSCWVWVEPQKASAATSTQAEAGKYFVRVFGDLTDSVDNGASQGDDIWMVHYKTKNGREGGTTGTTTLKTVYSSKSSTGTNFTFAEGWASGWPTSLEEKHSFSGYSLTNQMQARYENIILQVRNEDTGAWTTLTTPQKWSFGYKYEDSNNIFYTSTDAGIMPSVNYIGTVSDMSLTIPTLGSGATVNTSAATVGIYDQYGVRLQGDVADSYRLSLNDGQTTLSQNEYGAWINNSSGAVTVYVNETAQKTIIGNPKTKQQNIYLYATKSGVTDEKKICEITLNYSDYLTTVNADGSVTGLGSTMYLSDGTTTSQTWAKTAIYGADVSPVPTSAEKDGYTFYDFWTKPQPTSGNASYNVSEANFAEPVTTEEFIGLGGTADGTYITDATTGKQYYNAGEKWDSKINTTIGAYTYYGWWLSKDISVKFYDVDGKYLSSIGVKAGQTQKDITWPTSSYRTYTSGAFTYAITDGVWVGADGEVVDKSSYTFTHDLLLTPQMTTSTDQVKSQYSVTFKDPLTGANLSASSPNITYREDISGKLPAAQTVPSTIKNDLQYSYSFVGWTKVVPTNDVYYHILVEDGDFDESGKAIGINTDWIIRADATYYAVYRRSTRTYAVNFTYTNAAGVEVTRKVSVAYGDRLTAPMDYVPYSYASGGYEYPLSGWRYSDGSDATATMRYDGFVIFTSENIKMNMGAVDDGVNVTPVAIRAVYGAGVATPYTVTFKYRNAKGEELKSYYQVKHGEYITQDILDNVVPATDYDNGEALVTYMNSWAVVEGAAEKESYTTNNLTLFSPTSHITFEAEYGNDKYFYTVTYVDGTKTKSYRILEGENIAEWTEKVANENEDPEIDGDEYTDKVYVPTKASTEKGEYIFMGWYDAKQTDDDYLTTNGKKYTTADKLTGNLTLYPQFKYSPFTYTIKFVNYDGSQVFESGEFEYGQPFNTIFSRAMKQAAARAADETYEYTFIGWDQPYNEENLVCEGKDVTYTAMYKASYRYYGAKWYNSKLEDGKWVADKSTKEDEETGKTVETALLATTYHTYNSKVNTPSVKATCTATAPAGQEYVFAGWYYKDAEGKEVKYTRGMLITSDMEFYAVYTLTAAKCTVTTVVNGETETYTVASGSTVVIPDPYAGYVDVNTHKGFDGWYTDEDCTTKFDVNTKITSDITLYAKFTESAHEYDNALDVTAPTYFAEGTRKVWCSCNPDLAYKTEAIAQLTDTVKPTGTIYLGSLGSWSSSDSDLTVSATAKYYANADTDIIINTNDTGDVNTLYNPAGTGIGIRYIMVFAFPAKYTLTADNYYAAQAVAKTVYLDSDDTKNGLTAGNYTVKLGDLDVAVLDENGDAQYDDDKNLISQPLQNGEEYVVYYYVNDKARNDAPGRLYTDKFVYDTSAPSITVDGKGNTAESIYCEEATVTVYEADATVKVDGAAVTLTETEKDGKTVYTYEVEYNEKQINRLITVSDKAGNTATKKIKVKAHDYVTKHADVTCTSDGYEKTECIVCGDVKSQSTVEKTGHNLEVTETVAATCETNGSTTVKCKNCIYTFTTEYKLDENFNFVLKDGEKVLAYPATGHSYPLKDGKTEAYEWVTVENGDYDYVLNDDGTKVTKTETVTVENPDESTEGTTETTTTVTYYQVSNIVYKTVTAPTCMTRGKATVSCTVCGEAELTKYLDIDADAHKLGTLKTLEPTCTEKGKTYRVCKLCTKHVTVEEIAAKGHGTVDAGTAQWVVTKAATCKEEGEETLQCTICTQYIDGDDEDTDPDTRKIAKTEDHKFEFVNTTTDEETGKKYNNFKCSVCDTTKRTEVVEVEVVKYKVTFINEDGSVIQEIEKVAGESVSTTAVTAPAKTDSTGAFKYTFASWNKATKAEGDDKYTAGESVKTTFEVTENVTLMPVYTSTKNIYTHKFITYNAYTKAVSAIAEGEETETETTWEYTDAEVFETMMNVVGGTAVPTKTPSIKATELFTFEFLYWADENGKEVEDFTVTYNKTTGKADRTFYAVFNAIPREYNVIYYANGTEYVWHTSVQGGQAAVYNKVDEKGTVVYPAKDYDDEYHYTFSTWHLDAALSTDKVYTDQAIVANTQLFASFTKTEHTYDKTKGTKIQEATCTEDEITEYKCACGHTIKEVTKKALGHTPGEAVGEPAENPVYMVVRCTVCKQEISRTELTVKVTFDYNNGATTSLIKTYNLNAVVNYDGAEPTKASDVYNTYTFKGWYVQGDETQTLVDFTTGAIKATKDVTYVAKYEAKARTYNVTYIDLAYNTLKNYVLKYGDTIPEYEGDALTKESDSKYHYVFDGWTVKAGTTVTDNVMIMPVFKAVAHSFVQSTSNPSCEEAGGIIYKCNCGYSYNDPINSVPALGHKWTVTTIPATYDKEGLETKICDRCGEKETTVLPKLEYRTINVTVKDSKGNTVEGAKVELWKDGVIAATAFSNSNGKVTFTVTDEGKYTVVISGVADAEAISYDINVGDNGYNDNGNPAGTVTIVNCKCSCHRDGFWGAIFRMFHNLIKLFTGKISCCSCPDSRY